MTQAEQYEKETGNAALTITTDGVHVVGILIPSSKYLEHLTAKADRCDELESEKFFDVANISELKRRVDDAEELLNEFKKQRDELEKSYASTKNCLELSSLNVKKLLGQRDEYKAMALSYASCLLEAKEQTNEWWRMTMGDFFDEVEKFLEDHKE